MQIGIVFPQIEIGPDPIVVRDYAQAAEAMGYEYLLAFDHVLGANSRTRNWTGPYDHDSLFHEPFVLFGFLAGQTTTLGFTTGIVILPQRQTALVAKQAAAVDVLSGGRLRLGIGIGWNEVEFEALGEDFHNRGKRSEEQVEVLRALWTKDVVTYKGKWHSISDAGLNPMPVQQPIPILFGGMADPVLRRAAKLGDGWLPQFGGFEADGKTVNAEGRDYIQKIRGYITEAGRDPDTFQIDGRVTLGNRKPEECVTEIEAWRELGATHVSLNTMRAGLSSPDAHIDAMRRFKEELG